MNALFDSTTRARLQAIDKKLKLENTDSLTFAIDQLMVNVEREMQNRIKQAIAEALKAKP